MGLFDHHAIGAVVSLIFLDEDLLDDLEAFWNSSAPLPLALAGFYLYGFRGSLSDLPGPSV
jgi:hypothetical protein